jgi:hypothetical protein
MSISLNTFRQFHKSGFVASQALDGGSIPLTRFGLQVVLRWRLALKIVANYPLVS